MSKNSMFKPNILGFLCNWCCYAGADLCGVSRFQYPPYIRIIRIMCTGRVDPAFILRAFLNGNDGVFIGGCWPGECHYVTEGNYHTFGMTFLFKKLLKHTGINPKRLRLEWVSASEGIRFAGIMNEFAREIKDLGAIGRGEAIGETTMKFRLNALMDLLPYIKLVERERLRVGVESIEAYEEFYNSKEADKIIRDLIIDNLEVKQIISIIKQNPLSNEKISETLGLDPSEVSRHVGRSIRQGLIKIYGTDKFFV